MIGERQVIARQDDRAPPGNVFDAPRAGPEEDLQRHPERVLSQPVEHGHIVPRPGRINTARDAAARRPDPAALARRTASGTPSVKRWRLLRRWPGVSAGAQPREARPAHAGPLLAGHTDQDGSF